MPAPCLSMSLFGSPRVEVGGEPLKFDTRKAIALLAYLALRPEGCSRDELAGFFWPEADQERARSSLRYTLWSLKKALGEHWLVVEREHLSFPAGPNLDLDVNRFQQRLADCRSHGHPADAVCARCLPLLAAAVDCYRGDFMAGFYLADSPPFDDWQRLQREEWQSRLAAALDLLAKGHTARQECDIALAHARRRLAIDPLDEPGHRLLMQLYAWSGQVATGLRQYAECQRLLEEELGVRPQRATRELYESLKAGRLPVLPQLSDLPGQTLPAAILAWAAETDESEGPICVEREPELERLLSLLQQAVAGQGQVFFVTGEAGSGKTILLGEFARRAQHLVDDLLVASGFCLSPTGLGDPYLPFRNILRLLSGDLEGAWFRRILSPAHVRRLWADSPRAMRALLDHGPDLINGFVPGRALWERAASLMPDEPHTLERIDSLSGRQEAAGMRQGDVFAQVTAVLQSLARQRPLLLLIDDLHWADAASLSLLFYLGQQLAGYPIMLVGSYRSAELSIGRGPDRHPLQPLVNEFTRQSGDIELNLDRLRGREFVDAWVDTLPNRLGPAFRATLYRHTQGQPLFTVELLRAMQARGEVIRDAAGNWVEGAALVWDRVPAQVAAVISERTDRLPDDLHYLLSVACVEGEIFTLQVIAQVLETSERLLIHQLSQLAGQYQLVHARGEIWVGSRQISQFQFAHSLFRQHLYQEMSAPERRLLHREIARRLAALYGSDAGDIAAQLAHHHSQAGQRDEAIKYLLQAGDQARNLHAHREAVEAYQQAVDLLQSQGGMEELARGLMKLGLAHHMGLEFSRSQQAFAQGFALRQQTQQGAAAIEQHTASEQLRLAWIDPATLDPTLSGTRTSTEIINHLFSGLLALTPDLDIVPDVAQGWEVRQEGLGYLFHLRDDVFWSDGVPVTADDFCFAWRRALNPATGSFNANLLYDIVGARSYHQGAHQDPQAIGVRALDPRTLAVDLVRPSGHFLYLMANCASYPVPGHTVERFGSDWSAPENLVTNGPFRLQSWEPGQKMSFSRNPAYHGSLRGNLAGVELLLLPAGDWQTRLKMYQQGTLDVIRDLPPLVWDRVRQQLADEYFLGPWLETRYLGFDLSQPPFSDRRVRQAIGLATDKVTLANVVMGGYYLPATGGFIPSGMSGHSADIGLAYEPERARLLLAEAGYPGGHGFPVVRAQRPPGLESGLLCESLAAQWQEVLGLQVVWETMDWGVLRLGSDGPPMFLIGWTADYPDPDNFLRVAAEDGGWGEQAAQLMEDDPGGGSDWQDRLCRYAQADRRLVGAALILPLFYGRSHLLVKPRIRRFATSSVQLWFWERVLVDPTETRSHHTI